MAISIKSTKTVEDAAAIHCRYWGSDGSVYEKAFGLRDRIIDREDPEWPHQRFWDAVEELSPDPRR